MAITIDIDTARPYQVHVGTFLLEQAGPLVRATAGGTKAVIVTDTNVGPLYQMPVKQSLEASGYEVSVDLPEPEGPIITSFSPRLTVRLISLSTCRSPKYLLRCLISIMSAMNVPSLRLHELNYCTERTTFPQPTLHSRKEPATFHPLIGDRLK